MDARILQSRQPLQIADLSSVNKRYHRILLFDPSEIYNRIEKLIKPLQRKQSIGMDDIFPDIPNSCACGCGKKLSGRRRRWATDECKEFPLMVFWVIKGDMGMIGNILYHVYGWKCCECGRKGDDIARPKEWDLRTSIEIDHILGVKHGGGGSWLSNYRLVCFECHRQKTNKDFGWKSKVKQLEIGKQQELFK